MRHQTYHISDNNGVNGRGTQVFCTGIKRIINYLCYNCSIACYKGSIQSCELQMWNHTFKTSQTSSPSSKIWSPVILRTVSSCIHCILTHTNCVAAPLWCRVGGALRFTWSRKETREHVCPGQHVQLHRVCLLMNGAVHFHINILALSLHPSSLNSCIVSPPVLHKGLLSHHCGSWFCHEPGLGAGWERPSRLDMSRCLRH